MCRTLVNLNTGRSSWFSWYCKLRRPCSRQMHSVFIVWATLWVVGRRPLGEDNLVWPMCVCDRYLGRLGRALVLIIHSHIFFFHAHLSMTSSNATFCELGGGRTLHSSLLRGTSRSSVCARPVHLDVASASFVAVITYSMGSQAANALPGTQIASFDA